MAALNRIVLAYSGGLDTSVAIAWLAERHHADVIAVTMDVGQGGDLEEVRDRALATGAARAHVLDVRDEFARDYVLPSLKADALHDGRCPMVTALGRPLIAAKLVEIARIERAGAVAHGCAREAHDWARLAKALNPEIAVLAPVREWGMTRSQELEWARSRGVRVPSIATGPCRIDSNLWGRSIDCGPPGGPGTGPPEDIYTLTKSPSECPDDPACVEVAFEQGVPVSVNGVAMPLVELIGSLTIIAGAHGVGRIEMVGHQPAGIGSGAVCEAPAALVLHAAHRELQTLVVAADLRRFARTVSRRYAEAIHDGRWISPLREALAAFVETVQERVTGRIRLKLFKSECRVVGRQSPYASPDPDLAPAEPGDPLAHAASIASVD